MRIIKASKKSPFPQIPFYFSPQFVLPSQLTSLKHKKYFYGLFAEKSETFHYYINQKSEKIMVLAFLTNHTNTFYYRTEKYNSITLLHDF